MKFLVNVSSALVAAAIISFLPHAVASSYNPDFDVPAIENYNEQRECLALNIYHEAKGESELGQRAVAYVTLNRANDDRFPGDICGVVKQARLGKDGQPRRNQCQFSWYCDGKSDEIENKESYQQALLVATVVINTYGSSFDPTMGATMYHADSVKPKWRKSFEETTQIENHIFYR